MTGGPNLTRLTRSRKHASGQPEASNAEGNGSARPPRSSKTQCLENPPWSEKAPPRKKNAHAIKESKPVTKAELTGKKSESSRPPSSAAAKRKRAESATAETAGGASTPSTKPRSQHKASKRPKVARATHKHQPAKIDVDKEEDQHVSKHVQHGKHARLANGDDELTSEADADSDTEANESDEDIVDNKNELVPAHQLNNEVVNIVPKKIAARAVQRTVSTTRMSTGGVAEDKDKGGGGAEDDAEEGGSDAQTADDGACTNRKLHGRRLEKLVSERPQVTTARRDKGTWSRPSDAVPPGPSPTPSSQESSSTNDSADGADANDIPQQWLPRTEIILEPPGSSQRVALKKQNADMKRVLKGSYQPAKEFMLIGTEPFDPEVAKDEGLSAADFVFSPFTARGLECIGHQGLISSADALGFRGRGDVLHRLQNGPPSYVDPPSEFTAKRLSTVRCNIKKAAGVAASHVFALPTMTKDEISQLIWSQGYIFPKSNTQPGNVDKFKPFEHEVIWRTVQGAFFSSHVGENSLGFTFSDKLRSSNPSKPRRLEVTISMVALAAVAVAAALEDAVEKLKCPEAKPAEFAGNSFHSLHQQQVKLLSDLQAKKPTKFHRVMHTIFRLAVGGSDTDDDASESSNPSATLAPRGGDILTIDEWDQMDDE
ncbi:hypothetical protein CONPUDRAFT_153551 [Coniophora puteana RWD-64-598 SS2]|uniref:DUF6532 domain-containing protein n=1 Tax=Coniophora puteana (strain RWD-64-598) TaxID=741705 RepID=A0A5M3MQT2_CONPW|nr:uncharacterized protein CONPUDRAFT_153551 [Coniophora puteana RWD-64-598 SS2]EIW81005.1 hypothetical protein CONPUDRAFT_153551 [Coniophora puteana RWD-64-598 SS2]